MLFLSYGAFLPHFRLHLGNFSPHMCVYVYYAPFYCLWKVAVLPDPSIKHLLVLDFSLFVVVASVFFPPLLSLEQLT